MKKSKNDAPRINNVLFLVLWMAGHAAAWMLASAVNSLLISLRIYESQVPWILLVALEIGIPTTLVQLLLVERGLNLKKKMRGWLPVSLIGWILSCGLTYWLSGHLLDIVSLLPEQWSNPIGELASHLFLIPVFVPVALLQWALLRRKVKSASLWVLSSAIGAMLVTLLQGLYGTVGLMGYLLIALAALLYSAPTGATMLHLWTQSDEKAKNKIAQTEMADVDDGERLARLRDENNAEQADASDVTESTRAAKAGL